MRSSKGYKRSYETYLATDLYGKLTQKNTRGLTQTPTSPLTGLVGGFSFADSDAATYAAAIEGDGVTLSDDQKQAIDTFYTTGKSEGWYSDIARLYLTVWGQASANSRCLVSGTQGTFNGSIGHNAGYIDNPSYSGFMDTGSSAVAKGLSLGSQGFGFLQVAPDSSSGGCPMGGVDFYNPGSEGHGAQQDSLSIMSFHHDAITGSSKVSTSTGISGKRIYSTIEFSGDLYLDERTSSGFSGVGFTSGGAYQDFSSDSTDLIMAINVYFGTNPTASNYWGGQMGAAFYHSSSDSSFNEYFTLGLKNLWEGCTGLSL